MSKFDYDLITIGAGSGGVRASRLAAGYGARVAVIEESRVGGTCVMRGCVPKKLLVYGAHYAESIEDAVGFGWSIENASHDWGRLVSAKDKELDRLESVYNKLLENSGVELIRGRGCVMGPNTVEVDGRSYTADRILIGVGGWPHIPDFPGAEHVITSNEALDLKKLPDRIVIVGAGYIGLEFAGIFNALGSEVHVFVRANTLLRGFDIDIRSGIAERMQKKGIIIHYNTNVQSIKKSSENILGVKTHNGVDHKADCVMFASGRTPNTQGLGLLECGVNLRENGSVIVDKKNQSSVPTIYAVGDVTDRINLTPVAINEGRVFAETFYNNNPITLDYQNIASAVFTQPAIGVVGLTEEEAKGLGKIRVYKSEFRAMKHTLSGRDERTLMKLIVEDSSDKVLGCHMIGEDAPEIIQGLAVAIKCGATKAQFDQTIGIHPTTAEEFVTMRTPI
jgi:glutathione reductase (NADPH)